jgi:hypothetical protein
MHTGFWWIELETKRQLGRPRSRLEDNIKMNLKEIEWEVVNWFQSAQDTD